MVGLPAFLPILFAQAAAGNAPTPSPFATLLPFLPAIPLFYFLLIRPQQQQEKKRKQMIDNLKKNDRVLTVGGIYGTVISVDAENDRVVLRVDDDGKIKIPFSKTSVVRVISDGSEKSADAS
jgi:preprotein translocase subunit YajC